VVPCEVLQPLDSGAGKTTCNDVVPFKKSKSTTFSIIFKGGKNLVIVSWLYRNMYEMVVLAKKPRPGCDADPMANLGNLVLLGRM
jgi:hypothetical protein